MSLLHLSHIVNSSCLHDTKTQNVSNYPYKRIFQLYALILCMHQPIACFNILKNQTQSLWAKNRCADKHNGLTIDY